MRYLWPNLSHDGKHYLTKRHSARPLPHVARARPWQTILAFVRISTNPHGSKHALLEC